MANALFVPAKVVFLGGGTRIDLDTDNTRIIFVDEGVDVPLPATDAFLTDIATGARIGESGNLVASSITGGAFDTDDITVSAVTGAQFESVVLFKETGADGTSDLIAYYDTATGLPFTPSGGDITVVVNGSGWFSL